MVSHITFEFELRYVSLQEDVDLSRGLFNTFFYRNRHTFEQFAKFELLLLNWPCDLLDSY